MRIEKFIKGCSLVKQRAEKKNIDIKEIVIIGNEILFCGEEDSMGCRPYYASINTKTNKLIYEEIFLNNYNETCNRDL